VGGSIKGATEGSIQGELQQLKAVERATEQNRCMQWGK
jgi:hypothetical protein